MYKNNYKLEGAFYRTTHGLQTKRPSRIVRTIRRQRFIFYISITVLCTLHQKHILSIIIPMPTRLPELGVVEKGRRYFFVAPLAIVST